MADNREIKIIPKSEILKAQQDGDLINFRRNAVGMIRSFAKMYPDEFEQIVQEMKERPRHSEPLVKFDL